MTRTAVVAGVGPGLGESLARKFAAEGCSVGLFARSTDYLEGLADDLAGDEYPGDGLAVPTDLREESEIRAGFDRVREAFGPVDLLVNHASRAAWSGLLDQSPEEFRAAWEVNGLGAFVCSQEAVSDMLDGGDASGGDDSGGGGPADGDDGEAGTVIFTGATSAIRGRGGSIGFSAAKFAARGMAESMARELGPRGVHVAHVVVDGQILTPAAEDAYPDRDPETFLDPDEIAETYWHLVEQDRSAWTLELDLRPHVEEF